ncbi:MAG: hypothetical protein FJ398_01560 [Verrucomicrobia bacterium]|nr:hypothetical protein [Verrucomicrobiota bacterium]
MSLQNLWDIVNKAVENEPFRLLLLDDPEAATRSVDLGDSERDMLKHLAGGPYASSRRGLMDVRKMIEASIEFGTQAEQSLSVARAEISLQ